MNIKWDSIKPTFAIGCGKCRSEYDTMLKAVTLTQAANQARAEGWKFTRAFGWICADCESGLAGGLPAARKESDARTKS